jgi:hypothetical protein
MTERKRGKGSDSPLGAFLIDIHNWSRKNIIECEIDGSVKKENRIRIKLKTIEIIRMMSDDLGMRAERIGNGQEVDDGVLRVSWTRAKGD